jgi:hypothetical protein
MSKLEEQNIIFYSQHPNDLISKEFMTILQKNPILDKQFIKVCVYPNYQNIKIPQKIAQLNVVPVLVAAGFPEPVTGNNALSWLKNNIMVNCSENSECIALDSSSSFSGRFSSLTNDMCIGDNCGQFFSEYVSDGTQSRQPVITTNGPKKELNDGMNQKLCQLQQMRDRDIPRPLPSLGGRGQM